MAEGPLLKQILVQRDATIPTTAKISVVTENPITDPNSCDTQTKFENVRVKTKRHNTTLSSVMRRRISDLKLLSNLVSFEFDHLAWPLIYWTLFGFLGPRLSAFAIYTHHLLLNKQKLQTRANEVHRSYIHTHSCMYPKKSMTRSYYNVA